MLIEKLKQQLIYSCGNLVDKELCWCPNSCEVKLELSYEAFEYKESGPRILT
jgi:hypothetical protein